MVNNKIKYSLILNLIILISFVSSTIIDDSGNSTFTSGIDATGQDIWADNIYANITESRISDLAHTVNTNANTICSLDEVLFGNGTCFGTSAFFDNTDTTYTNGSGISLVGTQFNHSDTSSVGDSDNSGNTFIQDLTFDGLGHVLTAVTSVVSIPNIFDQNLNTTSNVTFTNITADFYFGDGSQLTNIPAGSETDPLAYNGTLAFLSDILGYNYYNSTDFSISDYFTKSQINGFNFWNDTFATFNKTYADTLYSTGNHYTDSDVVDNVGNYSNENSTIARIGDCPSGQFVQNTTTSGVQCLAPSGSGDITAVNTNGAFLTGGATSGDVSLLFNTSVGNITYYTQTFANNTFIKQSNEANLNVNKSDFWDSLTSFNSTTFEQQTGSLLGIKISWLTSFIDSWLTGKTTDDLTEGSTNLYDNQTWNESRADGIYQPIGSYLSNFVEDSTPQQGGNLDSNGFNYTLGSQSITNGTSTARIYHNGTGWLIVG